MNLCVTINQSALEKTTVLICFPNYIEIGLYLFSLSNISHTAGIFAAAKLETVPLKHPHLLTGYMGSHLLKKALFGKHVSLLLALFSHNWILASG